jgi:hypothetical protein
MTSSHATWPSLHTRSPDDDPSLPANRLVEGDFRVGRVFGRASAVLSRNFLAFFVVSALASLPSILIVPASPEVPADSLQALGWKLSGVFLMIVLGTLSQAIVLHGAFQDLRGRRVDLADSARVGLARYLQVLGVGLSVTLLGMLGIVLLVVPGLIWLTRWFVAMSACVVEDLGVSASMRRSAQLTEGHRWKLFAVMLLLMIADVAGDKAIGLTLTAAAGDIPALIGRTIWIGVWGAFNAIFGVVAYRELRVAKEGIDTAQIGAVFE